MEKIYSTTIDYLSFPLNRPKDTAAAIEQTDIKFFLNISGTTAENHPLPLHAYFSSDNPEDEKTVWNAKNESGVREYKIWSAKWDVERNKTWKITFAVPYDCRMEGKNNIYVLDTMGNELSQSIFYSGDAHTTTLTIQPVNDYIPGETYTLYIENVEGGNGEVLERSVKMDFTIKL